LKCPNLNLFREYLYYLNHKNCNEGISIFCFFAISHISHAQDYSGIWRGSFTYYPSSFETAIVLEIALNADSSLKIKSYTLVKDVYEKDSIMICKVNVVRKKGRKLVIEEIGASVADTLGLQTMILTYQEKGGYEYLEGRWYSKLNRNLRSSGRISFVKIKKYKEGDN